MSAEYDKAAMRRTYREKRDTFFAGLSPQDRRLAFSAVPSPLSAYLTPGKVIAGYVAQGSEADPSALLAEAHARGCIIALPYVTSRTSPMRFLNWSPDVALEPGPFGLQQPPADAEPCQPDLLLVPLVAFDEQLMRLGQGAGHYDRALSLLDNAIAIGFAWSMQEAPAIDADPWDIPMDAILTEKAWITR